MSTLAEMRIAGNAPQTIIRELCSRVDKLTEEVERLKGASGKSTKAAAAKTTAKPKK